MLIYIVRFTHKGELVKHKTKEVADKAAKAEIEQRIIDNKIPSRLVTKTVYGKVDAAQAKLKDGEVVVFDPETKAVTIMSEEDVEVKDDVVY